jgi:hypothetical protein
MGPNFVEVAPPVFERHRRLAERSEERLVQEFVAQPAVEALDEGVLGRLAGIDVMPVDLRLVREGQDGV